MLRAVLLSLLIVAPSHAGQFLQLITAAAAATAPQPAPGPAPTPSPGGRCDNCDGTGRLGDGTVSVPCPVCGGDGKLDAAKPPVPCDAQSSQMRKTARVSSQSGAGVTPQPVTDETAPVFSNDAEIQPTPMAAVSAGLNALNLKRNDKFVEFGSGADARWSATAKRRGVGQCVAVEIDPDVAEQARACMAHNGLAVEVITGDAATTSVNATCGAAYLFPDVLEELKPQIQKLDRFVSYMHAVPGGVPGMKLRQVGDLYVYEKPKPVAAQPLFQKAKSMAVWNGRQYSGPVCNRRGCTMCAAIRSQLWNR